MKFISSHDIYTSQEVTFQRLSQFDLLEQFGLKRGAQIQRQGSLDNIDVGLSWDIIAKVRGKDRKFEVILSEYAPATLIAAEVNNRSMQFDVKVDILGLSKKQTRITITTILRPNTLASRLLVQSLKLARSKANKRYAARVTSLAMRIEQME